MLSFGRTVWLYFIAVASHKYVLAFCIAMQLVTSGVRPCIRHEGGHKQTYKTKYNIYDVVVRFRLVLVQLTASKECITACLLQKLLFYSKRGI